MTRVVAGSAGGRRLVVPDGPTRPTSDRAREGFFSTMTSVRGDWAGAGVLDLYAGSGAIGLEAASRGAARVVLVESGHKAIRAIRANIAALGLPGVALLAQPVEKLVAEPPAAGAVDVAFLDPPYHCPAAAVEQVLQALYAHGWLRPAAVVAVERASRGGGFAWPEGLLPLRQRRYGEATIHYAHTAS